jgi:Fur family ferric uptake transcriptional regulator
MKHLHQREKEELERLLTQNGHRRAKDVVTVLDAFLKSEDHQSADDLHKRLKKQDKNYDFTFVQEALELFCRYGFAQAKEFKDKTTLYEHRHLGRHHDHLICTRCGQVEEFVNPKIEELQVTAARKKGFVPLEHRMDIYGLCPACAHEPDRPVPLSQAEPGECLVVCGHTGGDDLQRRLTDMGLNPGVEVEVLGGNGGPLVVACRGSRLALGRGMCEKVMVKSAPAHRGRKKHSRGKGWRRFRRRFFR